jgi:transglutaminase-like putative cysteine protease
MRTFEDTLTMAIDVRERAARAAAPSAWAPGERLSRGGGWWTVILTLVLLTSVAEAVNAAGWSSGLGIVRLAMIGGAVLGLLLALTRWDWPFPVFYSFLASIFWITTLESSMLLGSPTLHDAVRELVTRNWNWTAALLSSSASTDNLIFVSQLSYLGWWLGYFAIWSLIRHQHVLRAVLPLGIALLFNLYYSPLNLSGYLIVFLLMALLLAVRIELTRNETAWQSAHIRYAPDIFFDFLKAGTIFAVVVVGAAWITPDVAGQVTLEKVLRPFDKQWQRVEDTWARMYKSLNYPATAVGAASFGDQLTLGGPVTLSDRPIFDAATSQRSYWQAMAYDTYTGQGWQNTDREVVIMDRNQTFGQPIYGLTAQMTSTIHLLLPGQQLLFGAPQPLRTDLPVNADVHRLRGEGSSIEVSALRSRVNLTPDSHYEVVSAVTMAPPDALRAAGGSYPEWVTQQYLQLPPSLPRRVVRLARRITEPFDNAFDKASAVENYLRTYPYNQDIAAPPAGVDGVDYFLFDIKQGYCDYYASAMAVMLRAVGIPARVVAGYSPGEYMTPTPGSSAALGVYRVLERNAHAWPEVFFPPYGWIQFEPTASEPLLSRPVPLVTPTPGPAPTSEFQDEGNLNDLPNSSLPPEGAGNVAGSMGILEQFRQNWIGMLMVAVIAALVAGGWWLLRRRKSVLFRDSELVARLFGLLEHWAARLRVPWPASHTPLEHATELGGHLPEGAPAINRLARLFVAERYGRQQPSSEALAGSAEDWLRLEPLLWKRWLRRMLRS